VSTLYRIVAISVQCFCYVVALTCLWFLVRLVYLHAGGAGVRVCARVQVFVDAKAQVKDKPEEFVRVCMQLLDAPRLEAAVQVRVHGRTHPHTGCRNLRSCPEVEGGERGIRGSVQHVCSCAFPHCNHEARRADEIPRASSSRPPIAPVVLL
jgi:hypothetical protein